MTLIDDLVTLYVSLDETPSSDCTKQEMRIEAAKLEAQMSEAEIQQAVDYSTMEEAWIYG